MRADLRTMQLDVIEVLGSKKLILSSVAPEAFRQKLREAGYYSQWRETFGEKPWALLEKISGSLA
ncbi:hypothetical protein D3C73_1519420 [compost metagenome]